MIKTIVYMILGLLISFAIAAIIVKRKGNGKKIPIDYFNYFIIGIIWLPTGILMRMMDSETSISTIFIVLGVIYAILGLKHKNEWKKNHKKLKDLDKNQRIVKISMMIVLALLIVSGMVIKFVS